jgi:hypothetical protein
VSPVIKIGIFFENIFDLVVDSSTRSCAAKGCYGRAE